MFVGAYISYKIYNGSIRANIFVMTGIFLKLISWLCLFMIIALLTVGNTDVEYHLSVAIPVIVAIGLISLIIGVFLDRKAEDVGARDFENKIKNDLKFAKKMAKLNERNKVFYMDLNPEYAEYVESGQEARDFEEYIKNASKNKTNDMIRNIVGFALLILFFVGAFCFLRSL